MSCILFHYQKQQVEFCFLLQLCLSYPLVAKTLREAYAKDKPKNHEHTSPHCCGAMALVNGPKLGYDDLNHLMEKPSDYLFRIGKFSTKMI